MRNFKTRKLVNKLHNSTLVASVSHGHQGQSAISHAMVLDTYDSVKDLFIFKNTYNDEASGQPKQFKIKRTDPNAPKELFFVHIEVRDMANLPSEDQRRWDKVAEAEKMEQLYMKN